MHQSVTCNCLKISNIIQLSKLVLLQPWQSLKTTFGMLDLNWCHFLCFPAVCQRTWKATLSTVCVKHMIKKYSGMSEVWKQTSHVIYPQHSWVTLLTLFIRTCPPFSWCWQWLHLVMRSTHMEYISCVSAGSVNCLFTGCDQWCSWTFNALMSQFNQSNIKNEAEMQTLLQVLADHRRRLPDICKSILKATSVQSYWNLTR